MLETVSEINRFKSMNCLWIWPGPLCILSVSRISVIIFSNAPMSSRKLSDAERFRIALRNVLENALKYGYEAHNPVEISLRSENGFARIDVRDFGPGIPEDEQRLVFEPFYRVDRSRSRSPGYGLGLSLSKRVMEAHGGTIQLNSRVGEGTTVTLLIPLQPNDFKN